MGTAAREQTFSDTKQLSFLFSSDLGQKPKNGFFRASDLAQQKYVPTELQLRLFDFQDLQNAQTLSEIKRLASVTSSEYVRFLFLSIVNHFACRARIKKYHNSPTRFAPRTKHKFLDRHFPSFVAKRHELFDLSVTLANMGKTRVGDVVQLTHREVEELTASDPLVMQSLLDALGEADLSLGMKTPGWSSPGGLFHSRW